MRLSLALTTYCFISLVLLGASAQPSFRFCSATFDEIKGIPHLLD